MRLSSVSSQTPSRIGFWPALSSNVLNMVGIGPFVTIPLVLQAMAGPQAMLGWFLGALLALCDGLVWAEFGAAIPQSGGSYTYLREAFGPARWGRLFSFLFLFQVVIASPLTAASGAVGLAEYATYLHPTLSYWQERGIAIFVCLLATALLYRNIRQIGTISVVLTLFLLVTMGWIIFAGAAHFQTARAFQFPPDAFHLSSGFWFGLGTATLIAMYDYSGYFNVCLIGSEVKDPARNIPRSVLVSIVFLALCYAAMSLSIIGVMPWQQAAQSKAVVSEFAHQLYGPRSAIVLTALILVAAFGSLYSVLLGYSRVPYAAARNGDFFRFFARTHPTKDFPTASVLCMGFASALFCVLPLGSIITALLTLQIVTQFIAQCVGLLLLRRTRPQFPRPFRMWLYPLPALIALMGWCMILVSTDRMYIATAASFLFAGIVTYLLWARARREWPFGLDV